MDIITSTSNQQVKNLLQLQKKAKERTAQDVFIVEGPKMYQEVPEERLVHTYVSESFYNKNKKIFEGGQRLTLLSDRVFESVSDTKTPQGVLCLVPNVDVMTRWVVLLYCTLPASYLAPSLGRNERESVIASGVCSLLTVVTLISFCIIAACS